jgi:hypothetical protein
MKPAKQVPWYQNFGDGSGLAKGVFGITSRISSPQHTEAGK